jgi:hypothetical protein
MKAESGARRNVRQLGQDAQHINVSENKKLPKSSGAHGAKNWDRKFSFRY